MKSLSCPNGQMLRAGEGRWWTDHPPRFLQDHIGEASSYRCRTCGKTFCSTTRTPYHRLQHRRAIFDEVAAFSVEGLNKSAIARAKRLAWSTVHRWLEQAAAWCRRFSHRKVKGLSIAELQVDDIRTMVGGKERPVWVFAVRCRLRNATDMPEVSHYRKVSPFWADSRLTGNYEKLRTLTSNPKTFDNPCLRMSQSRRGEASR
jgi:hypothetical protein